jgi:hypothetical protein
MISRDRNFNGEVANEKIRLHTATLSEILFYDNFVLKGKLKNFRQQLGLTCPH